LDDAALPVPAGHRSTIGVEIHCVGFDIPNSFIAGDGLDYAEQYHNLRGVCVLEVA
jgi:hypoxanthine-guanine phosphoribosyltransferase